jgi:hypothetical protein
MSIEWFEPFTFSVSGPNGEHDECRITNRDDAVELIGILKKGIEEASESYERIYSAAQEVISTYRSDEAEALSLAILDLDKIIMEQK